MTFESSGRGENGLADAIEGSPQLDHLVVHPLSRRLEADVEALQQGLEPPLDNQDAGLDLRGAPFGDGPSRSGTTLPPTSRRGRHQAKRREGATGAAVLADGAGLAPSASGAPTAKRPASHAAALDGLEPRRPQPT